MKEVVIQRLYRGRIDIQSIVLNKCFIDNEPIRVTVKGKLGYMILQPDEFKSKCIKVSDRVYESKFKGGKPYKLVTFDWKPIK